MSLLFQKLVKHLQLEAECWAVEQQHHVCRGSFLPIDRLQCETTLNRRAVAVGTEPVTSRLWVGLTQSSCASAAPQLKSASDVPLEDLRSGEANCENNALCALVHARRTYTCMTAYLLGTEALTY